MRKKHSFRRGSFDPRQANHIEPLRKQKPPAKHRKKNSLGSREARFWIASAAEHRSADYVVWTDGSCVRSQDGPGAWAYVVKDRDGNLRENCGYSPVTTVNREEMRAALFSLQSLPENCSVLVISDSLLLVKCSEGVWKKKANSDLWRLLDAEICKRDVSFRWVKAHNGDAMNERCDELCRIAGRSKRKFLHGSDNAQTQTHGSIQSLRQLAEDGESGSSDCRVKDDEKGGALDREYRHIISRFTRTT